MTAWLRALDFNLAAPGSNPSLGLFLSSPEFNFSAVFVDSQLVCFWPVGILTCYF